MPLKVILPTIFSLCIISIFYQNKQQATHAATHEVIPIIAEDSIVHFTISSVGDLMCHSGQFINAKIGEDTFNFDPSFELVKPFLESPDLLLGNLETTFGGAQIGYSGYPQFNTPDDYAKALKNAGFDFLTTANNHSNDTGEKGILRTISILDQLQIGHTGTFLSPSDRDSIRIVSIKGVQIGIIAYTYSTNGLVIPETKPYLVNYMDSAIIKSDINLARKAGANLVIVLFHYGNEYERLPGNYQKQFINWAQQNGADIIIGSHPHVIQPAQFYKTQNATLDSGFVAYSLGNFFSNQKDKFTDEGIILNMYFDYFPSTKKLSIHKVDFMPTWVYRGTNASKKMHLIFPVATIESLTNIDFLMQSDFLEMHEAQKNTASIMATYTQLITQVK